MLVKGVKRKVILRKREGVVWEKAKSGEEKGDLGERRRIEENWVRKCVGDKGVGLVMERQSVDCTRQEERDGTRRGILGSAVYH